MLAVGPDVPAAIQGLMKSVVDAIRALQNPGGPSALAATTYAQLPPADKWRNCVIVVTDKNTVAVSTYTGSAWAWTRADGSAL